MRSDKLLSILLKLTALVTGMALFFVFVPRSWMAAIHERAGLGTLPDAIIVDYMARALSAFYAMHGGAMWLASTDVRRYAPLITYFAVVSIAFPAVQLANNLRIGFPLYWSIPEFVYPFLLGILILVLQAKARRESPGA